MEEELPLQSVAGTPIAFLIRRVLIALQEAFAMKDEFPVGPFMMMGLTIAGCTVIGLMIGGDLADLIGLGVGLVLGIIVFGVLSNLPNHSSYEDMGWRLDEPHTVLHGPRLWLRKVMQTLGLRHY